MAAVRRFKASKNPIRDMARYFMSSSWGVKNCFCNSCCDKPGNCCWEECSYIEMTLTDLYSCLFSDASCTTPIMHPAQHVAYGGTTRPPLDPKTNAPITDFRLYSAPGGTTNTGRGCENDHPLNRTREGQVWRTLETYPFRVFPTFIWPPTQPASCPPPTVVENAYLFVQYLQIEESGTRWFWWISPDWDRRYPRGSIAAMTNGTQYRCCGADWNYASPCEPLGGVPGYGPWARHVHYASIRPKSVTCCRDTTRSDFSPNCGLNKDGKEPAQCPCINGGWGWDLSDSDEPNCCASCHQDDCIDLPV